ncbi:hypothetical protein C2W62_03075 [Candidatus Entotheonella serta]|nr:hypothetical protein C2W62_03075 [Candidatus Entotheonella serta]
MKKINRIFKPIEKVTQQEWQLLKDKAHQVVTTADGIIESLRERERIAMYFSEGDLVGVGTVDVWPCEFQGIKTVAMYTGNAWYHPDFRRQNLMQYLALQCILATKLRYPRHLCYWVYGSNNYKSYLIMVKNFRKFWPRYDRETPPWELAYLRMMAERFYHHTWTTGEYGVIPNEHHRSFLSSDTEIPPELRNDPHMQFYQRVNPDYVHGARLICGAPFDLANMSLLIGRTLLRARRLLRHQRPYNT